MSLRRTALYDIHVRLNARLVDFAGWEMPLLYRGIVEEHVYTRTVSSFFDVSHMGRYKLIGDGAVGLLQRVFTRNVADQAVGQARYGHICKEDGGILDDVIVSRHAAHWGIVCNASNREKIGKWLAKHASKGVTIEDITEQTCMVAIQGPKTFGILGKLLPVPIQQLKRYHFTEGKYLGVDFAIFRTGYTGEDGVEIVVPAAAAPLAGEMLDSDESEREGADQIKPAGLGARDTLRLEAGMPLYGHELNEEIDSISAGQAWCVDLTKDFIGAETMRRVAEHGPTYQLVGLVLDGKRTARQHYPVLADGNEVGEVTSGALSPTLGKSIAMAYVPPARAAVGTRLQVHVKGNLIDATIVPLPFYKRPKTPKS